MGQPIFFTTPNGDRMTILALEDYESLRDAAEEAADGAAVDAVRRRLDAGEEDRLPAAFVQRMIEGESPVKVWRAFRGLTSQHLADAAGLCEPDVARIEAGTPEVPSPR